MYNERKDKLSIFNYLVYGAILLVIISIIIIVIVKLNSKPKKKTVVNLVLYSEKVLQDIDSLYGMPVAANMASFKQNILDYYANKLGTEKVDMTVTLQELYDKHFLDQLNLNGIECDSEKSKAVVTKKSGEYKVDVILSCGVDLKMHTYIGDYDYCEDDGLCEKKIDEKKAEGLSEVDIPSGNGDPAQPETPVQPETPEKPQEPIATEPSKYIYYEYVLKPNESIGEYSNWSDWSKEKIEGDFTKEVDKKTETETKTENCTETKKETYISGYQNQSYITGYKTTKYKVGTKKVQTGTRQVVRNGKVVNEPIYTEQPIYQTKEEPVYGTKKVPIYATREVKVDNCTVNTDYYRYRTFTYKKGINYKMYSTSDNDQDLINKGYVKTKNTKEA